MKAKVILTGSLLLAGCASLIPLKVGPPLDIEIEKSSERIARGEYLANYATGCIFCHSTLDWDYYGGGLPGPGTKGAGGFPVRNEVEKWPVTD